MDPIWAQDRIARRALEENLQVRRVTCLNNFEKSDQQDMVRLASFIPSFAPKDIPISSITALALDNASITFHTME